MKKKILLMFIICLCMIWVPEVLAQNITACETAIPGVVIDEKIPNAVSTIILLIKIAVPILLVIFGMLDLAKAIIAQKEEEIKKGRSIFIKRLITAAIVFFVVAIVQVVISFVGGNEKESGMWECVNCFINKECFVEEATETPEE